MPSATTISDTADAPKTPLFAVTLYLPGATPRKVATPSALVIASLLANITVTPTAGFPSAFVISSETLAALAPVSPTLTVLGKAGELFEPDDELVLGLEPPVFDVLLVVPPPVDEDPPPVPPVPPPEPPEPPPDPPPLEVPNVTVAPVDGPDHANERSERLTRDVSVIFIVELTDPVTGNTVSFTVATVKVPVLLPVVEAQAK